MSRRGRSLYRRRAILAACAAGVIVFRSSLSLQAGERRDDVPDSSYISLGLDPRFSSVGIVDESTGFGGGVLISPKWVLSAGHVVAATPNNFTYGTGTHGVGGTNVGINQFFTAPGQITGQEINGNDMGLIQITANATGVTFASRYFGTSDLGSLATYVGYGQAGTGSGGTISSSEGVKRAFTNNLDINGGSFSGGSTNLVISDFDDPGNADGLNLSGGGTLPTAMEGMLAFFDSGGGVFVDKTVGTQTRNYLESINSFVAAVGPPNGDGALNGTYSDLSFSTRVNAWNSWIDDTIANNWKTASNGNFSTAGNWSIGTMTSGTPTTGDIAGFNVAGTYTVTFTGPVDNYQMLARQGTITLNLGGFTYNLSSVAYDGSVVVGRYSGNAASVIVTNGTVTSHDAIIGHLSGSSGTISLGSAATWNLNGDMYVGGSFDGAGGSGTFSLQNSNSVANISGTMRVYGNGTVSYNAGSLSVGTLYVEGGRVNLSTGANKVLRVGVGTVTSGGKIDLADNDMIATLTTLSQIQSLITSGYNGGNWTGDGIASSKAASSPSGGEAGKTGLGFGTAGSLGLTTFDGISVSSSDVLVKYTYLGDANLDGKVDLSDMILFAPHWLTSGNVWTGGDFNYDGTVNAKDLTLLARNWQTGVSSAALDEPFDLSLLSTFGIPISSVPEPTSLCWLGIASLSLQRRRKRR
ncbi:MAG TPA: trypsin-like serine protease [Tepidisphaeraceae bacterium]|nr:trypsin-like serine protease [Tepidisphaeraceae bacterium]